MKICVARPTRGRWIRKRTVRTKSLVMTGPGESHQFLYGSSFVFSVLSFLRITLFCSHCWLLVCMRVCMCLRTTHPMCLSFHGKSFQSAHEHTHRDSFAYKITRCKRTKTHRTHSVLAFETNFRSSAIIVRLCASACVSVSVRYVRMSFACSGNWWRKWKMSRRKWKQQHIATYVPTVGVAAAAAAAAAGRATYWLFECVLAVK